MAEKISRERLVMTLFFAVLAHGIAILGVSFQGLTATSDRHRTVEVTIVQPQHTKAPDQADYLSRTSHTGSGNTSTRVRPEHTYSPARAIAGSPDRDIANDQRQPIKVLHVKASQAHRPQLLTRANTRQATSPVLKPHPKVASPLIARSGKAMRETSAPTATGVKRSLITSHNPRDRSVSLNTRKSRFAAWLGAWRNKVERIGNLHYPDSIRRRALAGSLTLQVAVNADGSVRHVTLTQPSQYHELNVAARRILRLAAPFKPFPAEIRADTDVLRFTYVWRFGDGRINSVGPR